MRAIEGAVVVAAVVFGCGNGGAGSVGAGTGSGAPATHALTIHVRGDGHGTVRTSSPSLSCTADCRTDASGSVVLTATPDAGSVFAGWQGGCAGNGACTVSMDRDTDVTATFLASTSGPVRITVALTGQGAGHVRSQPGSIDCPGTCSVTAPIGTPLVLTQQADTGSVFVGWGGGCSGSGGCSLRADRDVTVFANFDRIPSPPGTACAGVVVAPPLSVSRAVPMQGDEFTCWPGMGDGLGTLGVLTIGESPGDAPCACRPVRTFSFVDATTGAQKTFAGFLGSPGTHEAIVPQPDGFIVVSYVPSGPAYLSATRYDHDGRAIAQSNPMLGAPAVKESPLGGILYAGDFNAQDQDFQKPARHQACFLNSDLTVRWCRNLAGKGTVVGVGTDAAGNSIVITDGGSGNISAEWHMAVDGALPSRGAFLVLTGFVPGPDTWFETAPLIGGGVALRRVDQQDDQSGRPYTTSQWLATVPFGPPAANVAPHWLTSRPNTNMAIVRSNRAYAMLPLGGPSAVCGQTIDLIAADGTECGSLPVGVESGTCRTEDVTLALDGTPIQLRPREADPGSCSYRWWPSALR